MMPRILRTVCVWAAAALATPATSAAPLELDDVLVTVRTQYPPLLAAWLQQDIASGRIRQAQGAFDPILASSLTLRPLNYYDGTDMELLIEQPLMAPGGSVYGGYRLSDGFLPNYDRKSRTSDGGEAVLGVRLPLLRDREFDARRANMGKAALERELADPFILRQYIDFHRAARISYYSWLAAGKRLAVTEHILRIARERDGFLAKQAAEGAIAPIVQVDNQRLVVSREIAVLNATRRLEATAIELSLFYRDLKSGDPLVPGRQLLPKDFPSPKEFDDLQLVSDRGRATFRRPEVREIDLLIRQGEIDKRLANNNLKPNLDLAMEFNQALGGNLPSDIERTELAGLLKFSVPIGRNEAKGRLQAIQAGIGQLERRRQFARDRILADANNSFAEVRTAYQALAQTRQNVTLARQLETAENERFQQGASDLLALQIREQATFEAEILEIDALFAYFKALADYQAAVATDAPSHHLTSSR